MNKQELSINIRPQFIEFFASQNSKSINDDVQILLAIGLFVEKKVTLARAAELSEKGLMDFIKILNKHNIPWMEYTEETMIDDKETLNIIKGLEINVRS